MKALAFIVAVSLASLTAKAQDLKLNLEKTTDKHGLKLKQRAFELPSIEPQHDLGLKSKRSQLRGGVDSALTNRRIYLRTPGSMPRAIPYTGNIARIPNALPYFTIPDVAAIPNPLLRRKKDLLNSPSAD